jgi:hypothetical protein
MLLPGSVKTSGFFAPLNCWGQQDAINSALSDIKFAAEKAVVAADQTFLVKPENLPQPQSLASSRLLVVHNDAAAKAAAHLNLAYKTLKPFRTVDKTGLAVSGLDETVLLATCLPKKKHAFRSFLYLDN